MDARREFVAGVRAMAPLMVGIAPFALVSGVAAVDAGLSPAQAMGLSLFVFAGTAQLAAIDLLGGGAAPSVVVLTVAVVNARLAMYSASLAPHLRDFPRRWRAALSYLLTDHVYALAVTRAESQGVRSLRYYVLGLGATIWVVWQAGTLAGLALGATVPASWGLGFVVPLTFLAILVPELKERVNAGVALISGSIAVLGAGLPMNLGLLSGALAGVLAGALATRGER